MTLIVYCHPDDRKDLITAQKKDASTSLSMTLIVYCHPDDRKDLITAQNKDASLAQHDKRRTKMLRFAQHDINSLLSS